MQKQIELLTQRIEETQQKIKSENKNRKAEIRLLGKIAEMKLEDMN